MDTSSPPTSSSAHSTTGAPVQSSNSNAEEEENNIQIESQQPSDSLHRAAASVVDGIINDAVALTALNKEKAKVQRLINGLVMRARGGDSSSSSSGNREAFLSRMPSEERSMGAVGAGCNGGGEVAVNDFRMRRLPDVPLEWTQTRHTVTLNVRVPVWVGKRHIRVNFDENAVDVRIAAENHGEEPVLTLRRPLSAAVDPDGCMWALEGDAHSSTLLLELEKASASWWGRLFSTDDVTRYRIVDGNTAAAATIDLTLDTAVPNGHAATQKAPSKDGVDESSLEKTVSSVVEDMTAEAAGGMRIPNGHGAKQGGEEAGNKKEGKHVKTTTTVVEDGSDDEIVPAAQQPARASRKVLTRADLPKLVEQHRVAVEKGGTAGSEAAIQLATFYHYGIGVEQDDARAARLYRQGLEGGVADASAAFQLGLIYNQGAAGLAADAASAVRWWLVAAGLGSAVAMFNLGVMFMNGSGCEMDPKTAMKWFEQARLLDPKLEAPELTTAQLDQRIALAAKLKKERLRQNASPEERARRKEEALQTVRTVGYSSLAILGVGISVVALRYWWRNRL